MWGPPSSFHGRTRTYPDLKRNRGVSKGDETVGLFMTDLITLNLTNLKRLDVYN